MPRPRISPSSLPHSTSTRLSARNANNRMQENIRAEESEDGAPIRRRAQRRLFTSPVKVMSKNSKKHKVFYYSVHGRYHFWPCYKDHDKLLWLALFCQRFYERFRIWERLRFIDLRCHEQLEEVSSEFNNERENNPNFSDNTSECEDSEFLPKFQPIEIDWADYSIALPMLFSPLKGIIN